MSTPKNASTVTWPELAIGLYDQLTGRNAQITYEARDLEISVPSAAGVDAEHATWKMNGQLRIRTTDQ